MKGWRVALPRRTWGCRRMKSWTRAGDVRSQSRRQSHPGLHPQQRGQQGKGGDCAPLPRSGKTPRESCVQGNTKPRDAPKGTPIALGRSERHTREDGVQQKAHCGACRGTQRHAKELGEPKMHSEGPWGAQNGIVRGARPGEWHTRCPGEHCNSHNRGLGHPERQSHGLRQHPKPERHVQGKPRELNERLGAPQTAH